MTDNVQVVLVVSGLVAAAISGGAFFAFSNFVMRALSKLPAPDAVSAMQSINREAPNPLFVIAIVGAGLVGLPVAIAEVDNLDEASALFLVAGVGLSLAAFAITMGINVPKNNALDRLDTGSSSAVAYWPHYLTSWTRANTMRTVASLASTASYALWLEGR